MGTAPQYFKYILLPPSRRCCLPWFTSCLLTFTSCPFSFHIHNLNTLCSKSLSLLTHLFSCFFPHPSPFLFLSYVTSSLLGFLPQYCPHSVPFLVLSNITSCSLVFLFLSIFCPLPVTFLCLVFLPVWIVFFTEGFLPVPTFPYSLPFQ